MELTLYTSERSHNSNNKNMSNSIEYNCMLDCTPELRRSVEPNLLSLCADLLAFRLINDDKEKSLRNKSVDEPDRAAELVSLVVHKVQENPSNYHVFMDILKKDERRYNTIISQLEKEYMKYKSREGANCVSVPDTEQLHVHPSGNHNNGTY